MRRSHPLASATVWAALVLSAAACCGDAAGGGSVETTDSAGVVIVRSVSADLPLVLASDSRAQPGREGDEGRYLGTLPAGSPFPIGFLPDGRILVAEEDELDVQRLVLRTASFPAS